MNKPADDAPSPPPSPAPDGSPGAGGPPGAANPPAVPPPADDPPPLHTEAAHAALGQAAARAAYGRLVAYLAARWRDVAAAEDALAEAFAAALRVWPREGLPERPEAWLLAAAHRRLIDQARHRRVRAAAEPEIAAGLADALAAADVRPAMPFPDERATLLFVCAHPAITPEVRAPLMLQVVLGLDAARIAGAFLLAPAAMSQRLVRAKTKIRDARIRFQIPDAVELPARLAAVLEAIYAAYGTGWDDLAGADERTRDLAIEAIALGRAVAERLPAEPEALGLLALMLHCEARRAARRDPTGRYVPLAAQDPTRWNAALAVEAEQHLAAAARLGARAPGPFQLEAAIQSVHAARARTGRTDWPALVALYELLARLTGSLGARLGGVAALAEVAGPAEALARLDELPAAPLATHQPHWALRAHLLRSLGRREEAAAATTRAIGLSADPAVREFLRGTLAEDDGGAA